MERAKMGMGLYQLHWDDAGVADAIRVHSPDNPQAKAHAEREITTGCLVRHAVVSEPVWA